MRLCLLNARTVESPSKKEIEAQSIGCNLITVDISRIKYWRETQIFLDEVYQSKIEPLLKIKKAG
jgi:hypothetical protein